MAQIAANPWSFTHADVSVFTISSITEAGYIATATTSANHGYTVNELITLAGNIPTPYNGLYRVITVPSPTTFTYAPLQAGIPVQGLGNATTVGKTGVPAYPLLIRAEHVDWENAATIGDGVLLADINGNPVWQPKAPTAGTYSRSKPMWIEGLWIQQLDSGTVTLTVN